jgi:uncharacterized protein
MMTVPSLPKVGIPPAPPPLRKIALEEHFGHPSLFMRDSDGRFETRKEALIGHLGPEYFEVVQHRLLDFDTTRLEAMDEAGVETVLLSLTTFGIQAIADRAEAQTAARTVNDYLAEHVRAHPNRYVGMASLALHNADQAAREPECCVTKLGFKGVMVNGYSQIDTADNLLYLDDERMTPFWSRRPRSARATAARSPTATLRRSTSCRGGARAPKSPDPLTPTLEAQMKTPLELVQALLSDPTNIEHVRGLTTEDVTYVSLNFDNPELHKVLPWAGTNRGPQSIVDAFDSMGRVWETKAFEVRDAIANEHSVAMFGSFTYRTRALGKDITSPFALLAKVVDDRISYVQFLEDTFGTAGSFRAAGTWHFRGVAPGGDVSVGS